MKPVTRRLPAPFIPPPPIKKIEQFHQIKKAWLPPDPTPVIHTAVHESAHALAAIMMGWPGVWCSIYVDRAQGRMNAYSPCKSDAATAYGDAIVSFAGLIAEQVIGGCRDGCSLPDVARGDFFCAQHANTEYATTIVRARGGKVAIATERLTDAISTETYHAARVLVYRYWPLIEQMAYVAIRDLHEKMIWWEGSRLAWVKKRIVELDAAPDNRRGAFIRPRWLSTFKGRKAGAAALARARAMK